MVVADDVGTQASSTSTRTEPNVRTDKPASHAATVASNATSTKQAVLCDVGGGHGRGGGFNAGVEIVEGARSPMQKIVDEGSDAEVDVTESWSTHKSSAACTAVVQCPPAAWYSKHSAATGRAPCGSESPQTKDSRSASDDAESSEAITRYSTSRALRGATSSAGKPHAEKTNDTPRRRTQDA